MITDIKPYPIGRTLLGWLMRRHVERISGLEQLPLKTPFLIGANHIDFLDPFYIALFASKRTYRKTYFLSKTNNYWMFRSSIKIDENKPDQSLVYAQNVLAAGHCVGIFPEGQRNTGPAMGRGKTGLARLAMATRLPFVPVGLVGPSGRTFGESVRLLRSGKEKMWVQFGPPITYWEYYRKDATPNIIEEVTDHIMKSIAHLAHKRYEP